jgi:isoleucyl-tRNA synthetase
LISLRSEITKVLEIARQEKVIGHPLEAEVLLGCEGELHQFVTAEWQTIREIAIVSELAELTVDTPIGGVRCKAEEVAGLVIQVQPAAGEKCLRCWVRSTTVGEDPAHPGICHRCSAVLADLAAQV